MRRNNSGPRHVNQRLTRQTFLHAQATKIAKKCLLAINVDFLATVLECTLHAVATMQSLPHLRSVPVHMSNCKEQTACAVDPPSIHTPKISCDNPGLFSVLYVDLMVAGHSFGL